MKLNKFLLAGAITILSVGFATGCAKTSTSKSQSSSTTASSKPKIKQAEIVRIAERDVIPTMDSSHAAGPVSAQNLANTMDGLYRYEGSQLKAAMAEKIVKPTNKGLTYTFKIRPNAKWSNGDQVSADDFVSAWQRMVDPATKSQNAYLYEGIKNATEITAGSKAVDTLGVKSIDSKTLRVTMEKPIPYFDQLLASSAFYPQNAKLVKKWGSQYGTNSKTLAFNGPYTLDHWNSPDNTWTEVKNKHYWNAKNVKLNKVQYQVVKDPTTSLNLYQSNKLDRVMVSGEIAKQMKDHKDFELAKKNATYYITPNLKKLPLMNNAKIRQAISLSINRKQLIDKVLGGGSALSNSFTPRGLAFDPADSTKDFVSETSKTAGIYGKYDPAQAKKLWQAGLKETGNTDKTINLELLADDLEVFKSQSEFLQSELEKLPGLKITLSNVPTKTRLMRQSSGDFDLVAAPNAADFADPTSFLDLLTTNSTFNYGKWSNAKYDALIKNSSTTDVNKPDARWKDLLAAQNLLNEQQPVIALYQPAGSWLSNRKLKGMNLCPNSIYDMACVKFEK
ncbi:peptide ABC transporter substrate-binding protein [Xylocopilactobacillus apicola]|uniref:Peptide ABC transporter substrate-binding protein n=1 Tax=Xylocopilactobacillus apicola TaxID=2932184 RepID=A0AAU9DSZ5_9LACO|nr:peptide ABC transporter substrate-binding protein [Xylocopilactobacillus apicola]BDR59224.1 peptide ABC transporter substrate-binding protein [Xylocopilactobacillus apicola]